jgi:[acyl-carrier-protein] S-malonyltransferase
MSARLLILCPGQGGQHGGMFELARTDPRAAAFLDECALPQGDADTLFENRLAQPSIVAATMAMWLALKDHLAAPSLVAGYSVGELSAYGVAGAFSPIEAVQLAAVRARLMDEACALTPPQALGAIGDLALERARQLAQAAQFEIAIVTGHDSCIVGGLLAALPQLEASVTAAGGRLQRLPVAVASHTSLMAPAVAPFAAALLAAPYSAQVCPVLSGIAAVRIAGKELAAEHLSRQLCQTIEWSDCMDAAAEAGITVALELGPGAALARMLQARHPDIACRSAADFRSLDGVAAWLGRHLD